LEDSHEFFAFAFGQLLPNGSSLNREQDEKQIKEGLNSFVEAWNQHDAKAFSTVFAEDADFTNVLDFVK
jgi:hypothetical protein